MDGVATIPCRSQGRRRERSEGSPGEADSGVTNTLHTNRRFARGCFAAAQHDGVGVSGWNGRCMANGPIPVFDRVSS
jgi:hypothetical protein